MDLKIRTQTFLLTTLRAAFGTISRAVHLVTGNPLQCRFHPSCSEYAAASIARFGLLRGTCLAIGRVLRCSPLGGMGEDPVPHKLFGRYPR